MRGPRGVRSAELQGPGRVRGCILDVKVLSIGAASHEVDRFVCLDVLESCAGVINMRESEAARQEGERACKISVGHREIG